MLEPSTRLHSLDQFRGYTVLGMLIVNYAGGMAAAPLGLKHHHTYCNYADTIMPQFLFAVGFAFRLTYLRRAAEGWWIATRHALTRNFGLILLGIVWYHLTGEYRRWAELSVQPLGELLLNAFKRHPFETLTHIGVTSLWVLPVIGTAGWVRLLFLIASGALHVYLSYEGYYAWNLKSPVGIDGGPLGFLTWTIPLLAGSLAYDWVSAGQGELPKLLVAAALFMLIGYGLSLLNKFTPPNDITALVSWQQIHDGAPFTGPPQQFAINYWTMSQRAGSVTYLTFAAGFSLLVYALFRLACDRGGWQWSYFALFGRHALAAYLIHSVVANTLKRFVPNDSPGWYLGASLALFLAITTLFLRHLDRQRIFLKL